MTSTTTRVMNEYIRRQLDERRLSDIAREISMDWLRLNYAARPYLDAMKELDTIDTPYYEDSGKSIVAYFLANAGTWRGETARRVKAELKQMLKRRGW